MIFDYFQLVVVTFIILSVISTNLSCLLALFIPRTDIRVKIKIRLHINFTLTVDGFVLVLKAF